MARIGLSTACFVISTILSSCGGPQSNPNSTPAHFVILYNDAAPTVPAARDPDALESVIQYIRTGRTQDAARMKAFEVDGSLVDLPNGTRAKVLKEVTMANGISLLRVRVANGKYETEEFIVFSTFAQ